MDDAERCAKNTAHAIAQGADESGGFGYWWLRSPGRLTNFVAYIYTNGSVHSDGSGVIIGSIAVRPALYVSFDSGIFQSSPALPISH
jgi:hypothetical protein